ncbi:MAG: DUF58 domain-containing protein [Treponema sp.]|nr:DUF58 domain-containing protein [Treponema sp.]
MRESKASKPSDIQDKTDLSFWGVRVPSCPVPRLSGLPLIVIALLSLLAGFLRHELVLTLLGAVLLAALAYSFLAIFVLVLAHRKRAASLSARMSPEFAPADSQGFVLCLRENARAFAPASFSIAGEGKFFRLPGILIRYEICFSTKDGRILRHVFDPDSLKHNQSPFKVPERGAYYGPRDKLLIFDVFGFFLAAFALPQEPGTRFLSLPRPAAKAPAIEFHAGGVEQRSQPRFTRTDNLIDHRPYVPGDDPRRINWKLYGHAGDLFVREGEPEPPPHSKLTLLIDTQIDAGLFAAGRFTGKDRAAGEGRRAVDLLCENALAFVLEYAERGMEIAVGYTGGKAPQTGSPAELALLLAYPAALPLNAPPSRESGAGGLPELPDAPEDRAVLVLATPCSEAANSTLDRFLKKRGKERETDILFLYEGENLDEAAEICTHFYSHRPGIRARRIRLGREPV